MTNLRRNLCMTALLILAMLIQHAIFHSIGISRIGVNILFIYVMFIALWGGLKRGLAFALLCGLLEDLAIGRNIGLTVLAWGAAVFLMAWIGKKFYKENYMIPVVAAGGGMIIAQIVYLLGLGVLNGDWFSLQLVASGILWATLSNALLALLVYVPVYRSYTEGWLYTKDVADEAGKQNQLWS